MTEKQFLEMVINGDLTNEETVLDLRAKATEMLEALEKATEQARARRAAASAEKNVKEKMAIIDYLEEQTENSLAKEIAEAIEVSTQKASAVLRQMVSEGVVERIEADRNSPLEYRLVGLEFVEVEGDVEAE